MEEHQQFDTRDKSDVPCPSTEEGEVKGKRNGRRQSENNVTDSNGYTASSRRLRRYLAKRGRTVEKVRSFERQSSGER